MPAAFLRSPARGLWNLGPVPIRGYALVTVLGIIVGLWIADRRYRKMGGQPGLILDIATLTVPVALIGSRLYSVITDYHQYFGDGRDLVNVLRIWDGGLGLPGGLAAGALAAWFWCRRAKVALGPVAIAATPALAFGQAVGSLGNWFAQRMYGRPSTLPWAVAIAPAHRVAGYESYATFQPVFLYESAWELIVGLLVIWAIRRLLLTGDRAFALYAGLYAIGILCAEAVLVGPSPRLLGLRTHQVVMIGVLAGAVAYLYLTRAKQGPEAVIPASGGSGAATEGAGGPGINGGAARDGAGRGRSVLSSARRSP
jgi:prolipoprotein diacylglyceryl transferase